MIIGAGAASANPAPTMRLGLLQLVGFATPSETALSRASMIGP